MQIEWCYPGCLTLRCGRNGCGREKDRKQENPFFWWQKWPFLMVVVVMVVLHVVFVVLDVLYCTTFSDRVDCLLS